MIDHSPCSISFSVLEQPYPYLRPILCRNNSIATMHQRRAAAFIGAIAIVVAVAVAVLMVFLSVSLISGHQEQIAFPLVATMVQLLSCFTLGALVFHQLRRDTQLRVQSKLGPIQRRNASILVLGALPSLFAAVMVGVSLGWAKNALPKGLLVLGSPITVSFTVTFIVWGGSVLLQLLYFLNILWFEKCYTETSPESTVIDSPTLTIEPRRSSSIVNHRADSFLKPTSSSPPSLIASDGINALRSSFSIVQRPLSSRSGVLFQQTSMTYNPRNASLDTNSERPSQSLDSWDTSAVSYHIREAIFQSKYIVKAPGLEPIPGSRSPSPAKALEGPFFQVGPAVTSPQSPLPQPPVSRPNSPPSSPVDQPNFLTMFPPSSNQTPTSPPLQRNFSRPGSRARAPSNSEEHIHPLFRTSSPTPPPSATSGTILTAAPEAGQLVNGRVLQRMRSCCGSLPSSPSPLVCSDISPNVRMLKNIPSSSQETPSIPYIADFEPTPIYHRRKCSASCEPGVED